MTTMITIIAIIALSTITRPAASLFYGSVDRHGQSEVRRVYGSGISSPYSGQSHGKEDGTSNGHWDSIVGLGYWLGERWPYDSNCHNETLDPENLLEASFPEPWP